MCSEMQNATSNLKGQLEVQTREPFIPQKFFVSRCLVGRRVAGNLDPRVNTLGSLRIEMSFKSGITFGLCIGRIRVSHDELVYTRA